MSGGVPKIQSEQTIQKGRELVIRNIQESYALMCAVRGVERAGTRICRERFASRTIVAGTVRQSCVEWNNRYAAGQDLRQAVDPTDPHWKSGLDLERRASDAVGLLRTRSLSPDDIPWIQPDTPSGTPYPKVVDAVLLAVTALEFVKQQAWRVFAVAASQARAPAEHVKAYAPRIGLPAVARHGIY